MANHPYPDILLTDVVQEVVGEAVKVTATKPAAVEMEEPRVLQSFPETDLKLHAEIRLKLGRSVAIFPADLVEIRLDRLWNLSSTMPKPRHELVERD